MKSILYTASGALFLLACPPGKASVPIEPRELPTLVLGQGEQRLLRIPGLIRYSVGSEAVRALRPPVPHPDALLLKGVHPGSSDLWVWKQDGSSEHRSIRVEKVSKEILKPALERSLSPLQETEILLSSTGVILKGEISTLVESTRIDALSRGFPEEVRDETTLSASLLSLGERRLENWLRQSKEPQLRIENREGRLTLLGSPLRTGSAEGIRRQVRSLFPQTRFELETLPDDAPTIHFRVFLLEMKRSRIHSMGLGWPASQEGAFRVTSLGIEEMLQLDLTLQALEGEGTVRILSNPELVVRAPGEAELFSGGELPIHQKGRLYANVTWKNFGLTLKLKVSQVAGNRIRLEIFTEVSSLDASISSDTLPGLQANRMKTQVDARFGKPLFLSGLLQRGTRHQARGLPLLRQIPILGLLFGSDDYLNERSELVAILVPSAAPPFAPMDRVDPRWNAPRGPAPLPRDWLSPEEERALRSSSDFPWNVFERKSEGRLD